MIKKSLFILVAVISVTLSGAEKVRLWEGDAPLAKGKEPHDIPTLEIFLPPNTGRRTPAVIICPGGAYSGLAYGHEGTDYAKFLNQHGIAGLVLRYRTGAKSRGSYRYPAPQLDAKRAIRLARFNAKKWNINANLVGIMGSSAGGHLAAMTAVKNDFGIKDAADPVDKISCRPNFAILCYAQTSMDKRYGECCGSRANLIGGTNTPIEEVAAYKFVNDDTPPCFIWHTYADASVPVRNALDFANALEDNKVPFALHIYYSGRHGLGLGNPRLPWAGELIYWLKDIGVIR